MARSAMIVAYGTDVLSVETVQPADYNLPIKPYDSFRLDARAGSATGGMKADGYCLSSVVNNPGTLIHRRRVECPAVRQPGCARLVFDHFPQ